MDIYKKILMIIFISLTSNNVFAGTCEGLNDDGSLCVWLINKTDEPITVHSYGPYVETAERNDDYYIPNFPLVIEPGKSRALANIDDYGWGWFNYDDVEFRARLTLSQNGKKVTTYGAHVKVEVVAGVVADFKYKTRYTGWTDYNASTTEVYRPSGKYKAEFTENGWNAQYTYSDLYPPPQDPIKYYRLTFNDRALTCEPTTVNVQACTNNFKSGSACVESTRSTRVTLISDAKSSTDRISKPSGNFIGSTKINLSYLKEDDLTLSLTGKKYKCNGTSNCDINFADAGFFFSYDNEDGSGDIPNQVAGVNFSNTIKLDAFYNKNGKCKNIFKNNEVIPVKLGVQCQEPNICSPLNFVTNSVSLRKNNGNEESHYSAVNLRFNNNAALIDTAHYQDAGKINLIASYQINDNRNDLNNLTIKGKSNQFAVSPYKFKIKATHDEGTIKTELTAQDNNLLKHVHKSGNSFTFKIQALNLGGSITSNYLPNSNDNLRIKLTRSMPKNGFFEGELRYAKNKNLLTSTSAKWVRIPGLPTFDKGSYSFVDSIYTEVGAIQINVKDTDYYGMKFSVDANFSDNSKGTEIGRFIPSQFELVSSQVDNYVSSNTDAGFTYMDQPELEFDYSLEAQNSQGVITKNYDGNDKATVHFLADIDGLDLSKRLRDYTGVWCDGVYQPESCDVDTKDKVYFSRSSTGPDGPMLNALFGIGITDKDGVELNNLNLPENPSTATTRKLSIHASELRYGRLTISDGYGPVSNDFSTAMKIEYFNGKKFITNNDDSITEFDFVDATLTDISLGGILPALSGSGYFTNGITQGLIIAAPNQTGEVKLSYTIDNWLKHNWEGSENGAVESPSANIVFGFFHGNDRVIYRRRLN